MVFISCFLLFLPLVLLASPLHIPITPQSHHMAELLGGSQPSTDGEGGKVSQPSAAEVETKKDSKKESKKRKDSKSQPNPEPKR